MSESENAGRSLAGLMRGMADEIAPQVRSRGAAAARHRGQVRAVRQRVTLSCLVLLIGIGGVITIGSRTGHHSSPAPATSISPSPEPVIMTIPPTGPPQKADANVTDPAAWLPPERLPFEAAFSWRLDDSADITVLPAPENNLGTCLAGDPAAFGASRTWQQGPAWASGSGGLADAQLYSAQFFFTSDTAAVHGLATIASAYAACQGIGTEGGHVVDKVKTTWSGNGRIAILRTVRNPDGSPGSTATVSSDSHEYVVQDGTVIYFIGVYGGPAVDATGADEQILQAMRYALDRYLK